MPVPVQFETPSGLVPGSVGAGWFTKKIKIARILLVSTGSFLVVWICMTVNSGRMAAGELMLMAVNF